MFFSNTNRTNNTNLASAWHLLSLGNLCYKITAYQRTIYARTSENNRTESYGRRFVYFYCYIFAPCEADAAERDEAAALFIYNN